jgi:peptidoglycan/LPS O-acetylase OafA/YrhL
MLFAMPPVDHRGAPRRPDIQGLRALAVLLVVLHHADLPVPGGFVGVDVFFVISGFVLTRLLWRELRESGRIDLWAFYARRVKRLLPALAVVLAFVAVGSLIFQSPLGLQQQTARTGIAAALFAANGELFTIGGYFSAPSDLHPLVHTWSLAVEEQFYFVFPAVLIAAWWVARHRRPSTRTRTVAATIAGVFALSLAASVLLTSSSGPPFDSPSSNQAFAFYASPVRAWEFALGALLAIAEWRLARLRRAVGTAAAVGGVALLLVAAFGFDGTTAFPGSAALVPVLGAGLLVLAGTVGRNVVTTALGTRPLGWIGDLSYGWYLWHWPFIVFAHATWPDLGTWVLVVAAAASLAPAWLTYRFVEEPIRSSVRFRGRRVVALGLACALLPALLFAGLWLNSRAPSSTMADLVTQASYHADLTRRCAANLPGDPRTAGSCTWRVPHPRGTVVLVGDSNAGQFVEPAAAAANAAGFDLTLATYGGCPFTDIITSHDTPYDDKACRGFVSAWTDALATSRPSLVLLANASHYAEGGNGLSFTSRTTGEVASDLAGKSRLLEKGTVSTVSRLTESGVPVVVLYAVPQFDDFDLRTCPAFRIYLDETACGRSQSRTEAESTRYSRGPEVRAIAGLPLAAGVDFIDYLCTPDACSAQRDGQWIYRDESHLSVGGALGLTPRFEQLVRSHARSAAAPPEN